MLQADARNNQSPGDGGVQQHRLNERTAQRLLLIENVGVRLHSSLSAFIGLIFWLRYGIHRQLGFSERSDDLRYLVPLRAAVGAHVD